MKYIFLLISFFIALSTLSQEKNINDYKYIIVPSQFNWLKSPDQYKVNSLLEFLFNKHSFIAFLDSETYPEDLANNKCLALKALVKNTSGFLTTKNLIELRDCKNNVIFTSTEGKSKIKNYKKSYQEAIRNAFKSIKALNYNYSGKVEDVKQNSVSAIDNTDIKIIKPNNPIIISVKNILYAQEKENGYQLVDSKPDIVFNILKSSKKDNYFIKDKNGVLYKKGDIWIAEFYENNKLIQKEYQIKF